MYSSPFSKKYQARLLGKNQREKYPFLFKLISALDSNSRGMCSPFEKKSDLSRVEVIVVALRRLLLVLVRREFAFKALFAKSRGRIYSLFLSEDPPATKALKVKSQRHGKEDTKQIFHRGKGSCGCGVSNISSAKNYLFFTKFLLLFFRFCGELIFLSALYM